MNLERLITEYTRPKSAVDTIQHTKITLFVGISGAGKDTIKQALLDQPQFGEIISHTTRAPRKNNGVLEQDGVDYYYISESQAETMLENGEFVEAKFVHGTVYGTSVKAVQEAGKKGIAICAIDVQGVEEYKEISDDVIAIFVVPPNYDIWVERLKQRYATEAEFLDEWPKRRESAIRELSRALELPYYHCVINDDLERATRVSSEIAQSDDTFNRKDDEARIVARNLLDAILATH